MVKEEKQIDSSSKKEETKKEKTLKDEKGQPLTEQDIALIKRYGKGPYTEKIKMVEDDIKTFNTKITALCGIKESDTGLALPAQWNLQQDAMMMK
jgi:26S proteasome regulatory subunit T1